MYLQRSRFTTSVMEEQSTPSRTSLAHTWHLNRRRPRAFSLCFVVVLASLDAGVDGFVPCTRSNTYTASIEKHTESHYIELDDSLRRTVRIAAGRRYGPPMDLDNDDGDFSRTKASSSNNAHSLQEKKAQFRDLLESVAAVSDPQHVPSLLTRNIELILSVDDSADGVQLIESIVREVTEEQGEPAGELVKQAVELVVTFAEDFVQHAVDLQDQNQRLLGKIFTLLSDSANTKDDSPEDSPSSRNEISHVHRREQALDDLLLREESNLTPGFLRHLDAECDRIAAAPTLTLESTRLLQLLRVVQTRVLEQMAVPLGEAAQVLGQLVAYDSPSERLAVLEAGLQVRGVDFGRELRDLTQEALDGFQRVVGGADPNLVEYVKQIDARLSLYMAENQRKKDDLAEGTNFQ